LRYSDYLLRRLIGAGASGKVYLAFCRSTRTEVAVKFLRKSFVRDAEAVARFLAEADVLRRIKHPGIIGVHGIGADRRSGYFIAMDLARGGDLGRSVQNGPVAIADAVRWTIDAAEAIDLAHQHGIIHCDLKPSNLLLNDDGRVVVTDFGLARSGAIITIADGTLAGTPSFMAPEQISGSWGAIGPRTDVYGLGAVLYALLTGQPPLTGPRVADILANILSGRPIEPPASLRDDMPPHLSHVCMRCLAKRPADRFATAAELVQVMKG
jgi:serine/threonine protein kinase